MTPEAVSSQVFLMAGIEPGEWGASEMSLTVH